MAEEVQGPTDVEPAEVEEVAVDEDLVDAVVVLTMVAEEMMVHHNNKVRTITMARDINTIWYRMANTVHSLEQLKTRPRGLQRLPDGRCITKIMGC